MKNTVKKIAQRRATLPMMLWVVITILMLTCLSHILGNINSRYLFLEDTMWLGEIMGTTGGLTTLLASWAAQWAHFTVVGAAIIGVIFAGAYHLLRIACRSRDPLSLALIPVLYVFSGYLTAQFLLSAVALLLNFAIFYAWRSLRAGRLSLCLIPLALLLAYAATSTAFILVAILISADILFGKRSVISKIVIVGSTALVAWITPWVGSWIYGVSSNAAYGMLWIEGSRIDTTLFLLTGAVAVISNLRTPEWVGGKWWVALVSWIAIMASATVVFCSTFSNNVRQIMLIEQAADCEDWQSVITRSEGLKGENHTVSYLRNVALFRQGELVDHIFDYPQPFGPMGLFIAWSENNNELQIKLADLVYANIGMINEAHRLAFESMNSSGQSTLVLSRLAHYNRLLGREQIARKFEQRLSRTMFYDPDQSHHSIAKNAVSSCPDSIYTATDNFAENLSMLVAYDPTNKVAVDYLAIYYLLSADVKSFAAMSPLLRSVYGDPLPRIYCEALLLDKAFNPHSETNFSPDKTIATRFEQFNRALQGSNLQSAYNDWHSTYWYYVAWVMSKRSPR